VAFIFLKQVLTQYKVKQIFTSVVLAESRDFYCRHRTLIYIIGGSCHKYRVYRDKSMLVVTKAVCDTVFLSRQNYCRVLFRDKSILVETKLLSRQNTCFFVCLFVFRFLLLFFVTNTKMVQLTPLSERSGLSVIFLANAKLFVFSDRPQLCQFESVKHPRDSRDSVVTRPQSGN